MVQWLKLCVSIPGGHSFHPYLGTKMLHACSCLPPTPVKKNPNY